MALFIDSHAQTVYKYLLKEHQYQIVGEYHESISYEGLEGIQVDLLRVW